MQKLLDFKTGSLFNMQEDQINWEDDSIDLRGLIPVMVSSTKWERLPWIQALKSKGDVSVRAEHLKGFVTFVDEEDMLYGWSVGMTLSICEVSYLPVHNDGTEEVTFYCESHDDSTTASWLSGKQVQLLGAYHAE